MNNHFKITDDVLWDYADGLLQAEEKRQIEAYLVQHPEQKAKLEAILDARKAMTALPLESPNTGFAQQVMSAWATKHAPAQKLAPAKAKGQDWILWLIAVTFGLMILIPFWFSSATTTPGYSLEIPESYLPQLQTPSFDWAGFFNSALLRNFSLLAIAFMSLKLLDKYLQVKKHPLLGH